MDPSSITQTIVAGEPNSNGGGELKLVQPEKTRSPFWVHFMRYDAEFHPDKTTTARCNLCGAELSVKQGTGGLKNHLKFKHPAELTALFHINEEQCNLVPPALGVKPEGGGGEPAKKRPKTTKDNSISVRMDKEKQNKDKQHLMVKDKHLMEMWALTRRELHELRKELKTEDDDEIIQELERDVRILKKRKAEYAELLGLAKDEVASLEI